MVALRWGSATDTGRLREINEDSFLVANPLFAVADGMGGHAAGEVASALAVEALRDNATPTIDGVVAAFKLANRSVMEKAAAEPTMRGMGTTLSAVVLIDGDQGQELLVTNVGDSRVYRLHLGELEQLSEDHSLVEELVREGRLSPAEARVHPNRNIVTRTIGNDPDVDVDWWAITPSTGDRYLICSDGLVDEVDDHEIARTLLSVKDPDDAARTLVDMANAAGGRDNITVVIVDVLDDDGRAESASVELGKQRTSSRPPLVHETPAGETARSTGVVPVVAPTAKPKRFTWRVAVFIAAVVLVFVAAAGGTAWFARNTYYVGVDTRDHVAIYRGRPGGVLWIKPTVEHVYDDLDLGDIQPARRDEVKANHEVASREAAEQYVRNITTTATTTSTTTTTTTVSPPTTTAP